MLISISLVVAIVFFVLFIRAVKTGQYDDSHTPAVRMLFEDELVDTEKTENKEINTKTTK